MSSTLGLHYAPHLSAQTIDDLELAARQTGLPLAQAELLGQDETMAHAFVASIVARRSLQFLASVDWDRLEALYQSHQVVMPQILVN